MMESSNPFRRKRASENLSGGESSQDESSLTTAFHDDSIFTGVSSLAEPTSLTSKSTVTAQAPNEIHPQLQSPVNDSGVKPLSRRRPAPPPPPARSRSIRASAELKRPRGLGLGDSDPFESAEQLEPEQPQNFQPLSRSSSTKLNPFRKTENFTDPRVDHGEKKPFDINALRFGRSDSATLPTPIGKVIDVDAFKRLILTGKPDTGDNIESRTTLNGGPIAQFTTVEDELSKSVLTTEPSEDDSNPPAVVDSFARESTEAMEEQGQTITSTRPTSSGALQRPKPPPPRSRGKTGSSLPMQSFTSIPSQFPSSPALSVIVSSDNDLSAEESSAHYLTTQPDPVQVSADNTPASAQRKDPPPSLPLLRKHSTKRTITTTSPSVLGPSPVTLGKVKSSSTPPPPPPSRRVNGNVTGDTVKASSQSVVTPAFNSGELPSQSSKGPSPPPPPPRGTRRRVSDGNQKDDTSSIVETRSVECDDRQMEATGIGEEEAVNDINVRKEEDILADLERLQREVDALKGMVERQNIEDLRA